MPEISIQIDDEHHRYEHIDMRVLIDGVEYRNGRYPRGSYRHIMHPDNRPQLIDTLVALLVKEIVTDRDMPLAAAQNRANNTSIII